MRTFLLLSILASSFIAGTVSAQSNNVIYGIKVDSGTLTPVHLTSFDCGTFQTSIIYTFPPGITIRNFGYADEHSSFDAYNGRLFWRDDSMSDRHLYTFDIATLSLSSSPNLPESFGQNICYDAYNNQIILKGTYGLLLGYDLATFEPDTIAQIPYIGYGTALPERALNAYDQQFLFTHIRLAVGGINDDSIVLVNTASGSVTRNVSIGYPGIYDIQYDDNLHRFYGFGGFQSHLYSIDTTTLRPTVIANLPDTALRTNYEATYDPTHGRYILMYALPKPNSRLERRVAMYDVATGAQVVDTLFPDEVMAHYAGTAAAFRLQNNTGTLKALYGKAYAWTLNDTLLPNEQNQKLVSNRPGNYRCEVTFMNNNRLRSLPFTIAPAKVPPVSPAAAAIVSPNPFHDYCIIRFPAQQGTQYTLQVSNSLGQIVRSEQEFSTGSILFHQGSLVPGLYFYELSCRSGEVWRGRLSIQ